MSKEETKDCGHCKRYDNSREAEVHRYKIRVGLAEENPESPSLRFAVEALSHPESPNHAGCRSPVAMAPAEDN
jgi:hypothetical protein